MKLNLLLLFFVLNFGIQAQEMSWKEHQKLAEEMMTIGNYDQAADNFELAWTEKPNKKELLDQAAEAYRLDRNYRKAAELYKELLGDSSSPLAGLHYGKALKQLGQYQDARVALENFLNTYKGNNAGKLRPMIQQEIQGCGLAMQYSKAQNEGSKIKYLSTLNTDKEEFAPLPFSDDILYFSSTLDGKAKILRSQKSNGRFGNTVVPNLPRTPGGHFCHGTFTPDNERFYFTVCQGGQSWKGVQSNCDLYVTIRQNNEWSVPKIMRDYVKMDASTVTHPFVYHEGDTEYLYFSSNRSGGQGGLDIWYMTRQIAGKDIDFTYPVNAGPQINTSGDEITPFYNLSERKLYFSSNGHINIGGFDIFVVEGEQGNWGSAKNLELPYNSGADDYYFIQTPSALGSFFTSNRIFGVEKISSTDDDLYYIGKEASYEEATIVSGKVFEKGNQTALKDIEVSIYEKVDAGLKRLLKSQVFADGQYEFPILPERNFVIEASKEGYVDASFEFNTFKSDGKDPGHALYLEKAKLASQILPDVSSSVPEAPVERAPVATTPVKEPDPVVSAPVEVSNPPIPPEVLFAEKTPKAKPVISTPTPSETISTPRPAPSTSSQRTDNRYTNSRYKRDGVTTTAPRHSGVYFKVQLSVIIDYDLEGASFLKMQDMGRLDTEYIIEKGWTRVLLADFFDLAEARRIMDKARLQGYPEAFIVRYQDGYRKN